MNFLYQLLGSFWQGTSKHVRARFALSCAGNKCLKPKKCYFQASNGWKSDQFHVGRGDWHQLTSININFPEAIWSHVILCMLHAHDSWYSSTLPRYKRVDNGGLLEALALCSSSSILQILCNDCNERWLSCELLVRFSTVDMTPCRWCKTFEKVDIVARLPQQWKAGLASMFECGSRRWFAGTTSQPQLGLSSIS